MTIEHWNKVYPSGRTEIFFCLPSSGHLFRSIDLNNNGSAKATWIIGFLAPIIDARGTFSLVPFAIHPEKALISQGRCGEERPFSIKKKKGGGKIFKIYKETASNWSQRVPLIWYSISTPYFSTTSVSFFVIRPSSSRFSLWLRDESINQ